MLDSYNFF